MSKPIEDYALIGNTHTVALVARDGAIDWLCLPRFDSPACFAALLGSEEHGRWRIAPTAPVTEIRRDYLDQSLVLETRFVTADGEVALIDFMPAARDETAEQVVRLVKGVRGRVEMESDLAPRFDYGHIVPWVQHIDGGVSAVGGPDAIRLHCQPRLDWDTRTRSRGRFTVAAGQTVPFCMSWHLSHVAPPPPGDAERMLATARAWWTEWAGRCTYDGPWGQEVRRSLLVLKALTYGPTGGIVAAPTTSLPEKIGGVRNWDYRYCWLRDATFTLYALLNSGYRAEARAWREWLLRAVAGQPSQFHVLYGIAGERRITELELGWLPGYAGSRPVRSGNAAWEQLQIDIFGEVMDAFHVTRAQNVEPHDTAWDVQKVMLEALEGRWDQPDEGIWEVRGPRRDFTHSRVLAWVAMDRAVKAVERFGLDGPVDRWRRLRRHIHDDVCTNGFDAGRNSFVQYYGGKQVDAALLLLPLVGFLPPDDPRIRGTVETIDRELNHDGFIMRYAADTAVDGLPPGEGTFLACSFWMVDALTLLGRREEARKRFEALLAVANDVGLLAEEYDPERRRQLGNFPQAFSHVGLVNSAYNLATAIGTAKQRSEEE